MAHLTLEQLVEQLRLAWEERLHAVVLYGSGATAEHDRRSDLNVLVIVESVDAEALRAASATAAAWMEAGNPPPLLFTEEEWRDSRDIFPMEHADIRERHRVLYGNGHFAEGVVAPSDLRRQLEQEAMGKLLKLRQGMLAAGGDAKRQRALLEGTVGQLLVLFRTLLRLRGERVEDTHAAVVAHASRLVGFDPGPVAVALRCRAGERVPAPEIAQAVSGYHAVVQALNAYLDQLDIGAA